MGIYYILINLYKFYSKVVCNIVDLFRYKPAPLDLSAVTLTPKMDELVDQLAENTHNLWAKERIQQGWTYGLNEVKVTMYLVYRLPHIIQNIFI